MDLIHEIEKKGMRSELPLFNVGDTVDVNTLIREGSKERTQTFTGVVIAIRGRGIRRNFTVRRIVQAEGVERVFPFHSPLIKGIKIKKRGQVRRAKLYYLRSRSGKGARIRERIESAKPSKGK
jgi:large subunit ribosomal protein L19